MSAQISRQTRSVYRSILRELPARPLSSPSPLQKRIRGYFVDGATLTESQNSSPSNINKSSGDQLVQSRLEEAEQFAQYLRAQRQYATLVERYNPGANMDEQERVRLTARRVGMNLPKAANGEKS